MSDGKEPVFRIEDTAKFLIGATAGPEKSVSERRKMEIRFSLMWLLPNNSA